MAGIEVRRKINTEHIQKLQQAGLRIGEKRKRTRLNFSRWLVGRLPTPEELAYEIEDTANSSRTNDDAQSLDHAMQQLQNLFKQKWFAAEVQAVSSNRTLMSQQAAAALQLRKNIEQQHLAVLIKVLHAGVELLILIEMIKEAIAAAEQEDKRVYFLTQSFLEPLQEKQDRLRKHLFGQLQGRIVPCLAPPENTDLESEEISLQDESAKLIAELQKEFAEIDELIDRKFIRLATDEQISSRRGMQDLKTAQHIRKPRRHAVEPQDGIEMVTFSGKAEIAVTGSNLLSTITGLAPAENSEPIKLSTVNPANPILQRFTCVKQGADQMQFCYKEDTQPASMVVGVLSVVPLTDDIFANRFTYQTEKTYENVTAFLSLVKRDIDTAVAAEPSRADTVRKEFNAQAPEIPALDAAGLDTIRQFWQAYAETFGVAHGQGSLSFAESFLRIHADPHSNFAKGTRQLFAAPPAQDSRWMSSLRFHLSAGVAASVNGEFLIEPRPTHTTSVTKRSWWSSKKST